jgi:hypothetical protein
VNPFKRRLGIRLQENEILVAISVTGELGYRQVWPQRDGHTTGPEATEFLGRIRHDAEWNQWCCIKDEIDAVLKDSRPSFSLCPRAEHAP